MTPEREALVDFSTPLGRNVSEIVVTAEDGPPPRRVKSDSLEGWGRESGGPTLAGR